MSPRTLLLRVWGVLAAGIGAGAVTLQLLGPPPAALQIVGEPPAIPVLAAAPRSAPGTIALPDSSLLAPLTDQPGRLLPVIGADGGRSAAVYAAAPVAVLPNQARLALLVDGIGLDRSISRQAIAELPPPVSLAFSPYAGDVAGIAAAARARGHEMLVSLPMEPEGSPQNDEGDRELSPTADDGSNRRNLLWALSSLQGYVGVTAAETGQSGEHVLDDRMAMSDLTRVIAQRGLLFVDPRPGAAAIPGLVSARAAAVIDAEAELADQEAQLGRLAGLAQRDGQALGIVGPLRPASLARLLAWIRTLPGQGIVLVPVSRLAEQAPSPTSAPGSAVASAPASAEASAVLPSDP